MSDILDGLGTATEGGLFARILEPKSGAKEKHPNQPENCLNCGTPLVGAYCHACGQNARVHRTIGAFWHDLLHGALHFEGKLWRTLPMLVLRPGKLTRRYIEGARARFVSPMALFLFSVFLMFALFQALGITAPTDLDNEDLLPSETVQAEALEAFQEQVIANGEEADETQTIPLDENGNARLTINATGIDWIDEGIGKKWSENPSLMLYKLQANSYKFSWLLIPISIPFVWLLFLWKRKFVGYDHAIFVTYSLSFMTILFITLSLLNVAGVSGWIIFLTCVIAPPLHLYKHLRGTYSLSRFSTIWRLIILSGFIWAIIFIFLQILVVLGTF